MAGITKRVSLGLVIAMLGVMSASMLIPTATLADTNLVIGQQAVISYANGDQVRLRETPEYEGALIAMYDEGMLVTVLDGPLADAAGNFWYQVAVGEYTGFIVSDFLALENGVPLEVIAETTEEPVVADAPVDIPMADVPEITDPVAVVPDAPVSGEVIAIGWIANTNGDGVRCRAAADANAPVVTILPEGMQIEITGPVVSTWQPINCMGGSGFVAAGFVTTVPPGTAPIQTPATGDAPVVDQAPVASETPVSSETPVASETPAVTETAIASETPVAEETPIPAETTADSTEDIPSQTQSEDVVVLDADLVSGVAMVTGTNGDGVRCRARASSTANTITVMPEGATVQLTGIATGVWQPVFCNGAAGFISKTYLGSADASAESDAVEVASFASVGAQVSAAALTGNAVVTGTNGDGVRCRSAASTNGSIITVLGEGTNVSLRGLISGEWQPVVCGGSNGWVFATYLGNAGSSSNNSSAPTSSVGPSASATGSATVNSAPGGLNCRTSGSMSASIITVLDHGSTVSLRGTASNGWQPVSCGSTAGYVASQYLNYGGGTTSDKNTSGSTTGASYASGTRLVVSGTGGGGVRLRGSAGYDGSILSVAPEGASVTTRNGSSGAWIAVTFNGVNGFIYGDYLAKNDSTSGAVPNSNTSSGNTSNGSTSGTAGMGNGDHATTSDALNLRYSASFSAGVAAVAPAGTVILITGGISNGFYPVDWDGLKGFMSGDYLSRSSAELSKRGGSASNPGTSNGGSPSGTSSGGATGNAIVDYAMRYLGYPYVWATHGPSSFDCSGFTYWVTLNVLGRDIGGGLWTQVSAGSAVSRGNLQPGDLVFFQNTYTAGLSHVGIYIGNDQFIHAENESTGVRISDLNSQYYSSRWYGAVRLG